MNPILVISDLHGELEVAWQAIEQFSPEMLLCCGDWGDPDQVSLEQLRAFTERLPVYSTYGNHDPLDAFPEWRNGDGTPVLLENGGVREVDGLRIAGIGGIWAKSHRLPHYVTDEDVAAFADKAAGQDVDILLTHGCPVGLADLTLRNTHGGQRCFLHAFETIRPKLHLCGHLHRAQEKVLKDGRKVINVGQTPRGSACLIARTSEGIEASLVRVDGLGGESSRSVDVEA